MAPTTSVCVKQRVYLAGAVGVDVLEEQGVGLRLPLLVAALGVGLGQQLEQQPDDLRSATRFMSKDAHGCTRSDAE